MTVPHPGQGIKPRILNGYPPYTHNPSGPGGTSCASRRSACAALCDGYRPTRIPFRGRSLLGDREAVGPRARDGCLGGALGELGFQSFSRGSLRTVTPPEVLVQGALHVLRSVGLKRLHLKGDGATREVDDLQEHEGALRDDLVGLGVHDDVARRLRRRRDGGRRPRDGRGGSHGRRGGGRWGGHGRRRRCRRGRGRGCGRGGRSSGRGLGSVADDKELVLDFSGDLDEPVLHGVVWVPILDRQACVARLLEHLLAGALDLEPHHGVGDVPLSVGERQLGGHAARVLDVVADLPRVTVLLGTVDVRTDLKGLSHLHELDVVEHARHRVPEVDLSDDDCGALARSEVASLDGC
jgi:hypothetical protein